MNRKQPKRNETGHIIGAESLMVQFFSRVNFSAIVPGVESNDAGTGDVVSGQAFPPSPGLRFPTDLVLSRRPVMAK